MNTTHITIRGLTKSFAGQPLYSGFDLNFPRSKITSVFGPNGCGKSTLINMIAGLMPIDAGEILFDGKRLHETVIGYVFQNYRDALFPWKKSIDNIKYPLQIAGKSPAECEARTQELIQSFDVRFDLNRYPYELSGGQQQLISIMRALATQPEVLFLDEPFSALDYEMTLFMRDKLQAIFQATKTTMIVVSHDLDEAVYLADEVLMLTRRPTKIAEVVDFNAARPR
jgi:NitT/TauT family transport system ATP-binding protein